MLSKTIFKGMDKFMVIWAGQVVSLMGSAMTRFALTIWAYQQTGLATTLAMLAFSAMTAALVGNPLAGWLIDRINRRYVLIIADLGSGLATIWLLAMYATGGLQIWHLFVVEVLSGFFESFQLTSYLAASTLIVPPEQYARATGLRSMARSVGRVIAPFAAGMLLPIIGIDGIMRIDVVTFLVAVGSLLLIRIPDAQRSEAGAAAAGNFWHEIRYGFRFIWARPGLVGLVLFFGLATFFSVITYFGTLPAMILSRQGGGTQALAFVQSALGAGALVGSLLASTWGGPKRRIHAVLAGAAISFMLGDLMFAFGQNVTLWVIAGFCGELFVPFIIAGSNAIWQSKVPADVQGRVFAAQSILSDLPGPVGYLIAGPLADQVMNPGMMPGGSLAPIFGPLVGVGPGAGIAAMFIFTGFCGIIVSLAGYLWRSVRDVETELPDAHPIPIVEVPAVAEAAA